MESTPNFSPELFGLPHNHWVYIVRGIYLRDYLVKVGETGKPKPRLAVLRSEGLSLNYLIPVRNRYAGGIVEAGLQSLAIQCGLKPYRHCTDYFYFDTTAYALFVSELSRLLPENAHFEEHEWIPKTSAGVIDILPNGMFTRKVFGEGWVMTLTYENKSPSS